MDERRLKTCCFTGHRPGKLSAPEEEIRAWLEEQIDQAIADGYRIFISGCAMGVDIWAGQTVLRKRKDHPDIRLVCATPWPGMPDRWNEDWWEQYENLLAGADEVVTICSHYCKCVYKIRNIWMVDHSGRLIAYYNGTPGGTRNTILYADKCGIEVLKWGKQDDTGRNEYSCPGKTEKD